MIGGCGWENSVMAACGQKWARRVCLLAMLVGAGWGTASAQDIFLTPGQDRHATDTAEQPVDSPLFPGTAPTPDAPETGAEATGIFPTPPAAVGLPTLSNSAPAAVYPDKDLINRLPDASRPLSPEARRRVENYMVPQTAADFAVLQGVTPAEFNRQRAQFEKFAASNPSLQAKNPYAMVDLITDGQRYQKALESRVKAACDLPAFTVTLDMAGFMQDTRTRENINAKAIQPFGAALDSLCNNAEDRAKISRNFYMIRIQHQPGASPAVSNEDGLFTLSADFSTPDAIPASTLRAGIMKGVEATATRREQMMKNLPATP